MTANILTLTQQTSHNQLSVSSIHLQDSKLDNLLACRKYLHGLYLQASVESGAPAPVVVRKDKPPDYNSVLKMKELEEEELPSYTQATQATHLP